MAPRSDPLLSWLAERFGFELLRRRPIAGGSSHSTWCLELASGGPLFAKITDQRHRPWLEMELDGLRALAVANAAAVAAAASAGGAPGLRLPEPLALESLGGQAVLLLSWLDLGGSSRHEVGGAGDPVADLEATGWRGLGAALAGLHRQSLVQACAPGDRLDGHFGWPRDNVIGATPQLNGLLPDWGTFFVERRLAPQLELLARQGGALRGGRELLERLPSWLEPHRPEACLVHGDLWGGNAGLCRDGRGALFDPAVHRADREVDLAMARLFGGVPERFFSGYEQVWPLPAGHQQRRPLYNLYHLLNHANLFGAGYRHQAQHQIDGLLDQISSR